MKVILSAILGAGLLSACGGGGGGGGGSSPPVNHKLVAYAAELDDFIFRYETAEVTPAANLPTGRVSYRGVGVVDASPINSQDVSPDAIGRAQVDADFDANTVDARIGEFVDVNTRRNLNGTVLIQNGTLRDGVIAGDVSGSLAGGELSGTGAGEFYGHAGQAVGMGMNGTITGGRFDGDFEGFIVGDR